MQELSSSEGFPYNSCSLPSWEAHAKFLLALFSCPSTGPSHRWESQDWSLSLFSIPSISTEPPDCFLGKERDGKLAQRQKRAKASSQGLPWETRSLP